MRERKWKQLGFESWEAYQRDYRKQYMAQWYLKNKERHLANCRAYRITHRDDRTYRDWYKRTYLSQKTSKR